ncbi:MAG: 3-methyl-2-oxobutanoate hydroxymethyltransferase [Candidatus Omnitrophica bacterium]|nr:3-methyl-2-oxobutanoate hydroxymethyltransferase [Candidatus Omnitrophota bacterium]MBU1784079.1 3-methyl-2-oxobutanoate hydroxymethyltransferase [Candidatus Omnitrophota bacterium]MBU1851387.1 3-methyl-2-oxobutanoate hydroxymethyltransferase [Candidatus Omnitrophota bacterium]
MKEDKKFTVLDFMRKKESGEKITMLTAYDYPMASLIDRAGIDSVLVGDSLGMVVLGRESTVSVTMDEMIHHAKAVRRGVKRAFLIGDMPFMSYQASDEDAVRNAGRFIKESGCDAVKIEGGREICSRASAIIKVGIPVLGHVGLTPQSVSKLGGYKVQGKDESSAARLAGDVKHLTKAGCFAVILECIPKTLAKKISDKAGIPVIGIGAGVACDGQVLVTYDMIGYFDKFVPKFVKQYADISGTIFEAIRKFKLDIESGDFPDDEHSFTP